MAMKFKHGDPDALKLLEGKRIRSVSVSKAGGALTVELDDDTLIEFSVKSGPGADHNRCDWTSLEVRRDGRASLILESS